MGPQIADHVWYWAVSLLSWDRIGIFSSNGDPTCSTNLRIAGLSRDRDIPRYHGFYFQKHASNNPRSSTAAAPQLSLVIPSICFSDLCDAPTFPGSKCSSTKIKTQDAFHLAKGVFFAAFTTFGCSEHTAVCGLCRASRWIPLLLRCACCRIRAKALVTLWCSTWGSIHNSYPKTGKNRFKKVWLYLLGSCSQKLPWTEAWTRKIAVDKSHKCSPPLVRGHFRYPVWRQSGPAFVLRTPSWEDCANRRGEVKLEKRNN